MKKLSLILTMVAASLGFSLPTASIAEPYIGEVKFWGGNFAPRGYSFCDGQLLAISSNTALFSILGTTYGGDGRSTFGLPDMRGRIPIHTGTGPGLTHVNLGERLGTEYMVLLASNLPSHNHSPTARANSTTTAGFAVPTNNVLAATANYTRGLAADVSLGSTSVQSFNVGNNMQFGVIQPSLNVNCIISLIGIYPSRS